MEPSKQEMTIHVDKDTRVCLAAITVLLTVLRIAMWADVAPSASQVQAAEPFLGSATQRNKQLAEQKLTNAKLDKLIALLQSGQVKVRLAKDDDKSVGGTHAKKVGHNKK